MSFKLVFLPSHRFARQEWAAMFIGAILTEPDPARKEDQKVRKP